eukprot:19159_1
MAGPRSWAVQCSSPAYGRMCHGRAPTSTPLLRCNRPLTRLVSGHSSSPSPSSSPTSSSRTPSSSAPPLAPSSV